MTWRMKTEAEFIAEGWSLDGTSFYPPYGVRVAGGCVTEEMMGFVPDQNQIANLARGIEFRSELKARPHNGSYTFDPKMFKQDTQSRAHTKPFENIEEGGCICFMKKHRFSGHMRYCPAYS